MYKRQLFSLRYDVDVYRADSGEYVTSSTFVWPGWNCAGMLDMTNLLITFPRDATDDERAALIAGLMLVEYTVMERRRQQERNNRNQGGDGAPGNAEMAR